MTILPRILTHISCTNMQTFVQEQLQTQSYIQEKNSGTVRKKIRQSHLEKRRKIQIWNKTEGEGQGRSLQEKTMQWNNKYLGKKQARKQEQNSARGQRLKDPSLSGNGGQYESEMVCARIGSETRKGGMAAG